VVGASTPEAPEMGEAFTKALEIAESLGDTEYQLRALRGCISITPGGIDTVCTPICAKFHDLRREGRTRAIAVRRAHDCVAEHFLATKSVRGVIWSKC